jgi:hypothetical protein
MRKDGVDSTGSTARRVAKLSKLITMRVEVSASTVKLVEGLLFSFVGRMHGRCMPLKEEGRMVASFCKTARFIEARRGLEDEDITFVKTHLQILMSKAMMSTTSPERPDTPLFVGWAKRFLFRAMARRDLSLIYSLMQSKRAWRELGDLKRQKALDDHFSYICERNGPPLPGWLAEEIEQCSEEILNVFPSEPTKMMPSNSACLQAPRSKGGASSLFDSFNPGYSPKGHVRELDLDLRSWRQKTYESARSRLVLDPYTKNHLDVDVQIIPEPGKFRIITKGDGLLYTALQPVQGQLLSAWKKYHANTMSQNPDIEVQRILDNTIDEEDWRWISVDYTSATDLLWSESTMYAIAPLLNLADRDLAFYSLLDGGKVKYPDGRVGTKRNGQLMGHPLSFPLLCVINEAAVRASAREALRMGILTKRQARLIVNNHLVNGDDLLMRGPVEFAELFKTISTTLGLQYNTDKSYVSPYAALINSRLYQQSGSVMRRRGYLNLKILFGKSLKDGESASTPDQLTDALNEMMTLCPWTVGCLPMAYRRWSSKWKGWFQPNWFLPKSLGGYGVNPRFASDNVKVTRSQRLFASLSINDPTLALFRQSGQDLGLARWVNFTANWKLVPGEELLEDVQTDDWLARIAYIYRASHLGKVQKVSDAVVASELLRRRKKTRLKPVSWLGLFKWWGASLSTSALPACPPLNQIRTAERRGFKSVIVSSKEILRRLKPRKRKKGGRVVLTAPPLQTSPRD